MMRQYYPNTLSGTEEDLPKWSSLEYTSLCRFNCGQLHFPIPSRQPFQEFGTGILWSCNRPPSCPTVPEVTGEMLTNGHEASSTLKQIVVLGDPSKLEAEALDRTGSVSSGPGIHRGAAVT
jgi:hypothetical protein